MSQFEVAKISRRSGYRYEGIQDGCFDAREDTGFLTAITGFMWEAVLRHWYALSCTAGHLGLLTHLLVTIRRSYASLIIS